MSKQSRDAIGNVLSKRYTDVGITLVDTTQDLHELVAKQPDVVFLGSKFVPSDPSRGLLDENKVWLSNHLEEHNITHTGSTRVAHELDCDKILAKRAVQSAGLRTSPFCIFEQNQTVTKSDITLSFPLFVKPANRGGGLGIDSDSVVHTFNQLQAKVQSISKEHGSAALIEQYLPGREFSVAIMQAQRNDRLSVMPVELIAETDEHGHRILGADAKSANSEQVVEITDPNIKARVSKLAINAFAALGARDYGRVDIRLDADGVAHFLEANLIPSLIQGYGTFPKACQLYLGLGYDFVIHNLVELAMNRMSHEQQPDFLQQPSIDLQAAASL